CCELSAVRRLKAPARCARAHRASAAARRAPGHATRQSSSCSLQQRARPQLLRIQRARFKQDKSRKATWDHTWSPCLRRGVRWLPATGHASALNVDSLEQHTELMHVNEDALRVAR